MVAAITGDLINSTQYPTETRQAVLAALHEEFAGLKKEYWAGFEIYRGDGFQGALGKGQHGLAVALRLKTAIIKSAGAGTNTKPVADARISIGLGKVEAYHPDMVAESSGPAFYLSGRRLDRMKGEGRTLDLSTASDAINKEFEVQLALLEAIMERWSTASAEVVYYLLKGHKQQEIADIIGRSQAAVNLRKKAARWDVISLLIKRYEVVISDFYGRQPMMDLV